MAVLKKIRSRWWSPPSEEFPVETERTAPAAVGIRYDIRPLTISHLDECWRLDQRCFVDGEAYSRETFEYLLTAPESISFRAATPNGSMAGFVIGLIEPDHTGHITTVGVAPEHRRRHLAKRLMADVEKGFRQQHVRLVRLEVRSTVPVKPVTVLLLPSWAVTLTLKPVPAVCVPMAPPLVFATTK